MKKFLITASVLTLSLFGYAQKKSQLAPPDMPRNEENNQVYYMEVVTEDGIDKMELFRRGNNWLHTFYKNPTGIVESADSNAGQLTLKPQYQVFREKDKVKIQSAVVKYTLVISYKEGKYRYEIKDINIKSASYYPIERLFNASDPNIEDNYHTLSEAHKYFTDLIADLEAAMDVPSNKVNKDDW